MTSPRSLRCGFAAVLFFAALFGAPLRALTIYPVTIETSALAGTSGLLAFDLTGGDDVSANNTATVTSLATDGALGDASNFALTDTNFFNEELRSITFGTSLSFSLHLTDYRVGAGVDQFSFLLLDPLTDLPLFGTTDSSGADALFAIDLNGTGMPVLSTFESVGGGATWQVSVIPVVGVPETGTTVTLLGLALGLMAVVTRCRARGLAPAVRVMVGRHRSLFAAILCAALAGDAKAVIITFDSLDSPTELDDSIRTLRTRRHPIDGESGFTLAFDVSNLSGFGQIEAFLRYRKVSESEYNRVRVPTQIPSTPGWYPFRGTVGGLNANTDYVVGPEFLVQGIGSFELTNFRVVTISSGPLFLPTLPVFPGTEPLTFEDPITFGQAVPEGGNIPTGLILLGLAATAESLRLRRPQPACPSL